MNVEVLGSQPVSPKACAPSPELLEVQGLMPMAPEDRERLKDSIEREGVRDPIRAYREKGNTKWQILSGFNRWEIASELGLETIPLEIVEAEDRQAYAIEDNLARRHLTTDQKRKLVAYLLKQNPDLSDRQISKQSGTDHKTVSKIRKKAESTGEIPQLEERTGADGKQRRKPTPKQEPPFQQTAGKQAKPEPSTKHLIADLKAEQRDLQAQKKEIEKRLSQIEKEIQKLSPTKKKGKP
jgi:ParB-like chromosome segregation protein Spo0J